MTGKLDSKILKAFSGFVFFMKKKRASAKPKARKRDISLELPFGVRISYKTDERFGKK